MKVRSFISQTVVLAVVAGTLFMTAATPASAGPGSAVLYAVHGIPGKRVDVCVGGLGEVVSRMEFATKSRLELTPGTANVRVRKASKGACKGVILAKDALPLVDGDNVTAVVRTITGGPTITPFDNDVAPTAVDEIRLTAVHTMRGGAVDVWANGVVEIPGLARGSASSVTLAAGVVYSVWGSKVGTSGPIVGPRIIENTTQGLAFQFVMVGTKVENNRVVVFKQDVGVL